MLDVQIFQLEFGWDWNCEIRGENMMDKLVSANFLKKYIKNRGAQALRALDPSRIVRRGCI